MYLIIKESNNNYFLSQSPYFHVTFEEARTEAERLCRKERATFYILKVEGKCFIEALPVKWVTINE
jgi:hypothetical protein